MNNHTYLQQTVYFLHTYCIYICVASKCILNADLCLESVFPFVQCTHSKVFDEVSAECFVPIFFLNFYFLFENILNYIFILIWMNNLETCFQSTV